jgi:hypothetical protein
VRVGRVLFVDLAAAALHVPFLIAIGATAAAAAW